MKGNGVEAVRLDHGLPFFSLKKTPFVGIPALDRESSCNIRTELHIYSNKPSPKKEKLERFSLSKSKKKKRVKEV